jgi:hypothetical protein
MFQNRIFSGWQIGFFGYVSKFNGIGYDRIKLLKKKLIVTDFGEGSGNWDLRIRLREAKTFA